MLGLTGDVCPGCRSRGCTHVLGLADLRRGLCERQCLTVLQRNRTYIYIIYYEELAHPIMKAEM